MEIYLVGGAVRDKLLGLACHERDYVVVGASPEAMMALGFTPVGKDFPVFLHPETREEYALARTETKIARGYRGFSFHTDPSVTLSEDLSRRDLTINAMAENVDGQLIDPYGGQADLKARILRHVSPAFVEDPVRVLRLARFAARFKAQDFTIAPETMDLATALQRAGELDALVPERVWQECQKALIETHPEEFFITLKNCGGLNVLFPELAALFGIPSQLSSMHFVDSGMHALLSLHHACRLSAEPEIRFAALCHSVGKACLPPSSWPELVTYPDSAVEPLQHLADRYKLAQRYRDIALLTAKYHQPIQNAKQLNAQDLLDLLAHTDALRRPDRFKAVILAAEAGLIQNQQPLDLVDFFQPLIDAVRAAKPTHVPSQHNVIALKEAMYNARLAALKDAVKTFHQSQAH